MYTGHSKWELLSLNYCLIALQNPTRCWTFAGCCCFYTFFFSSLLYFFFDALTLDSNLNLFLILLAHSSCCLLGVAANSCFSYMLFSCQPPHLLHTCCSDFCSASGTDLAKLCLCYYCNAVVIWKFCKDIDFNQLILTVCYSADICV